MTTLSSAARASSTDPFQFRGQVDLASRAHARGGGVRTDDRPQPRARAPTSRRRWRASRLRRARRAPRGHGVRAQPRDRRMDGVRRPRSTAATRARRCACSPASPRGARSRRRWTATRRCAAVRWSASRSRCVRSARMCITADDGRPPLYRRRAVRCIAADVDTGVASAQVKTAAIFAALGADGPSTRDRAARTRAITPSGSSRRSGSRSPSTDVNGQHRLQIVPVPHAAVRPGASPATRRPPRSSCARLCSPARCTSTVSRSTRCASGTSSCLRVWARDVRWETLEDRMNEPVGHHRRTGVAHCVAATVDEADRPDAARRAAGARGRRDAGRRRDRRPRRARAAGQGVRPDRRARRRAAASRRRHRRAGRRVRRPGADASCGARRSTRTATTASRWRSPSPGSWRTARRASRGYECADVSWPGFDDVLGSLGAEVELGMKRPTVIAIDGPAGAGKSTVAHLVADRLGLGYVDTGATYRLVALRALEQRCPARRRDGARDARRGDDGPRARSSTAARCRCDGRAGGGRDPHAGGERGGVDRRRARGGAGRARGAPAQARPAGRRGRRGP